MSIKKIWLLAVSVSTLSACTGSSPSNSEIKDALKTSLNGCQFLSIDKFKKTNGIPRGEGAYQIDTEYSIKITPNEAIKKYVSGRVDEIARVAASASDATQKEAIKLKTEETLMPIIKEDIGKVISRACPTMSVQFWIAFHSGNSPLEQYADEIILNFTGSMQMIKTDNGWQIGQ